MGIAVQNIEQLDSKFQIETESFFLKNKFYKSDIKSREDNIYTLSFDSDTKITPSDINYNQPLIKLDQNNNI